MADTRRPDEDALDAYSRVVTSVARRLTPQVASVQLLRGGGSAVVFDHDHLITNAHVVGGSRHGKTTFSDGAEASFEVVGSDPLSDLAVLRVDGDLPMPAELGDADQLVVGQLVVALGSRLGLSGSFTAAVVSVHGRAWPARHGGPSRRMEDASQADAGLNPGNSGGACADSAGRVVGINTALAGIGVGLAVPM